MAKGKNARKKAASRAAVNPNPSSGTQLSPASVVPTISKSKTKREKKKKNAAALAAAHNSAPTVVPDPASVVLPNPIPAVAPSPVPTVPFAPLAAAPELSPLYCALRELYHQLKKPEGFKHISVPRLRLYLKKLEEIKKNDKLEIGGKKLWETLNPDKLDFRAEQLLEKIDGKNNILEDAIVKHEQHYVPQFKPNLTAAAKKYEPVGKFFYIEMIGGTLYLMIRDGANPSLEELQEAVAAYNVICQDMKGNADAKLYICDDAFTRDPENQKKIAAVVNHLDLNLADAAVEDSNKLVHKAVHDIAQEMKEPEPETAKMEIKEADLTTDRSLNYNLMTPKGRLISSPEAVRSPEQMQYLDMVSQLEQNTSQPYLQGISTLNRVLPRIEEKTYKQEEILVQLMPLRVDVQKEAENRAKQRKFHCEEEQQLQKAIKSSLKPDTDSLKRDSKEVKAKEKEMMQAYGNRDASVGQSDEELAQTVQRSLESYKEEQRKRLEDKHHYTIEDVEGDGNCFYHAVVDQMRQQEISRFNKADEELHTSLRRLVQGIKFKNREWADIQDILKLVKEANVVIAVVDTRYPELGFRCYFRNDQGEIAETYYPSEFKQKAVDKTIIRLAYTGNHYMSVRGHNALTSGALRAEFSIAKPLQPVQAPAKAQPPVSLSSSRDVFLPKPNTNLETIRTNEQHEETRERENPNDSTVKLSV